MNKKVGLFSKGLVIGVIILFIGIEVAPSINANIIKDEELIEYTTKICGFRGGTRTVKLTKEQSQEVEQLLDLLKEQIENSKSMEEAKKIFKEAVPELDKYGLLAGLSVEKAQKLVTKDLPLNIKLGINIGLTQNIFCLFSGTARITDLGPYTLVFCAPISLLGLFGFIFALSLSNIGLGRLGLKIAAWILFLIGIIPLKFMNLVVSANCGWDITSYGLKGLVESIEANVILGFNGLMIFSPGDYDTYYCHFLGFCLGFY
jgi:hypothetical protein